MSLTKIKLVTFDVTNTLLKFRMPAWKIYASVASNYGFKGTGEEVQAKFKISFNSMLQQHPNFGKNSIQWEDWWCRVVSMTLKDHLPSSANLDIIANTLIDEFKTDRCWECVNGGQTLIQHFKNLGVSVGVISNFDPRLTVILQNLSLHNYFDFVVTSYDTGFSKPDKRIFESAIDKCGSMISPSEALHIGDDVDKDYVGARKAGWHAVLVNPKLSEQSKPSQEHVFKSLEELDTAVKQQNLKL